MSIKAGSVFDRFVDRPFVECGAICVADLHKPHTAVVAEKLIDTFWSGIKGDPSVGRRLVPVKDRVKGGLRRAEGQLTEITAGSWKNDTSRLTHSDAYAVPAKCSTLFKRTTSNGRITVAAIREVCDGVASGICRSCRADDDASACSCRAVCVCVCACLHMCLDAIEAKLCPKDSGEAPGHVQHETCRAKLHCLVAEVLQD